MNKPCFVFLSQILRSNTTRQINNEMNMDQDIEMNNNEMINPSPSLLQIENQELQRNAIPNSTQTQFIQSNEAKQRENENITQNQSRYDFQCIPTMYISW